MRCLISDNTSVVWRKFFQQRTETLWWRFTGRFRAMVVETNDPLTIGRIRVKCPDMHDWDLRREDCPWAVPDFDLGGKRAGRWVAPVIGDWVWISFERNHPYGLVWSGFATPTRRKFYPYPSVFQRTPLSVTEDGRPADRPNDYQLQYLPKDGRPMSHGWQDRYGNLDMHSAVGFFPIEHAKAPPPPDFDAVQRARFEQSQQAPALNDPDVKFMVRHTKYGNGFIMSDQGYWWHKEGDKGEFLGDAKADERFEINRAKYLQRLYNEDDPRGDHRRNQIWTRYGHKIEARDTGWAQPGPIDSRSRPGEYGEATHLSSEATKDYRWIKLRTKGGMLRQMYDKGFHPQDDDFIKRIMLDEVEDKTEREDLWWANKDARQIRDVTRHGFKFVLDDRGSDQRRADVLESPRGNGALLKGRRSGGSLVNKARTGDPRGFYWEFNENDDANHTTWGSPLGLAMEMNDATEYVAVVAGLPRTYAMPWRGIQENEFLRRPIRAENPETTTHHLILDLENEYIRLKTRGGRGPGPDNSAINPADNSLDLQQGFEAHDGTKGDGPWIEAVDGEHRGLWFSKSQRLGIWRARSGVDMFILQDDGSRRVVIYNGEPNGKVQIYCAGQFELQTAAGTIVSDNTGLSLVARGNLNLIAGGQVQMRGGGTLLTVGGGAVSTTGIVRAPDFTKPGGGSNPVAPTIQRPAKPTQIEPKDRGQNYNNPSIVADAEIEHPVV